MRVADAQIFAIMRRKIDNDDGAIRGHDPQGLRKSTLGIVEIMQDLMKKNNVRPSTG